MPVIEVKEIWNGRQGSKSNEGSRSYTRVFRVRTDTTTDDAQTVRTATDIPDIDDTHPEDTGALANSVSARSTGDPNVWEVQVAYSTAEATTFEPSQDEDPLKRPAQIEWSFAQFTRPVFEAIGAEDATIAIVNSSGEAFDPPIEIDDSRPVLRITRNESDFNAPQAVEFKDSVNENTFFGGAPGQVKVSNISARNVFESGVEFWEVSYEFHFRKEGWKICIADRGLKKLVDGVPEFITECVKDSSGNETVAQPISSPVFLDGSGGVLSPPPPTGTPVFLEFTVFEEKDFDALGLP